VDLEKAFDRVPREVIKRAMHKLGVEEWLVSAVMSMYTGAKTVVKTIYGNRNCFEVKVSMHHGSALSPLLSVIVMEALSREFRVALQWELLYADYLVVIAETENDLIKWLNERKDNVKNRGMRVKCILYYKIAQSLSVCGLSPPKWHDERRRNFACRHVPTLCLT